MCVFARDNYSNYCPWSEFENEAQPFTLWLKKIQACQLSWILVISPGLMVRSCNLSLLSSVNHIVDVKLEAPTRDDSNALAFTLSRQTSVI